MTTQIETATITGTVSSSGNALVIVTASGMNSNNVKAVSVAVLTTQTAAIVAQAVRYALATDTDVAGFFFVSGTGADVVLTARIDASNDATMNIAVANDTCAGLVDTPTSANTRAGVSVITNGYTTLADFKAYGIPTASASTPNDGVIEALIESASRYIDAEAQRVFYTSNETRLFNMPLNLKQILYFDKDLTSISSVTNGDGSTLTSTQYVLLPANDLPKYALQILPSSSVGWRTAANGNVLQCISIAGTWGETCPADITEACLTIVKAAYNRRFGENANSTTTVTQAGLVITPEDVPAKSLQVIHNHRRIAFG